MRNDQPNPAPRRQTVARRRRIPLYNTEEEREGLRAAGRFNAQLMDFLREHVCGGTSTGHLDKLAYDYTLDNGHTPACLGYHGYPKTICTSVNEVVCHGIPNDVELAPGDIVNIDLTTIVHGWHGDLSETFLISDVSNEARRLAQVTHDALYKGIRACRANGRVTEIGHAIERFAGSHGYSVVREYQGHGIGREFHQEPGIPHFPSPGSNRDILRPGVCFTIEPMLNMGTWKTELDKSDGWTVRTADRKLSAQYEHTILMTEDGPEILTLTENGPKEKHQF